MRNFIRLANAIKENGGSFEMIRFLIVGVVSNLLGYLAFLFAIFGMGIEHKTAVTFLFCVGMAVNFIVNRKWTFKARGTLSTALTKFLATYITGYFINIAILIFFVDVFKYSAAWIQMFSIGILAVYYFFANKLFIHRPTRS